VIRIEMAKHGTGREMTGIFEGFGDNVIDLADEMLEELEPRAKAAVEDARDIWYAELLRMLAQRSSGAARENEPPVHRGGGDQWTPVSLLDSFRKIPGRVRGRVASAGFSSTHPGANRLEYGFVDRDGHETFAHPYLRPSYEKKRAEIMRRLEAL